MQTNLEEHAGVCPRCARENVPEARFCRECGAPLRHPCRRCGAAVRSHEKFCTECGAARPPDDEPAVVPASAERRHLSVLFCDVAGSTPISVRLDPEDFRELLRAFQRIVGDAVRAHDGVVAQYIGDGVVAHFGAPFAHEDAARRAVRAGLELLTRLERSNAGIERRHGLRLEVRVSVHSGVVVLGEIGDGTTTAHGAVGETMHLAARVCAETPPGALFVTEATARLVEGAFESVPQAPLTLRGFADTVHAFRITAERDGGATMRYPRGRLTPFVDREAEMTLLRERWAAACDGAGQVVVVGGEPGIGKSRLVQTFCEGVVGNHLAFQTACSPYHRASALYPILDVFARALDLRADDDPATKRAKLETVLGRYLTGLPDAMPLLAALLSIESGDGLALRPMTPQRQRRQTLEVLLELMFATARIQPVLIVVDDLHWTDPSTLEFLETMVEQTSSARLMTILLHRPEFVPPWRAHAHVTRLILPPLHCAKVKAVVRGSVDDGALAPEVVSAVAVRSEGNPLFAEELARMIVERARDRDEASDPVGIPPTLRDWLAARLDHLGTAKPVAQIASTIGRTFSYGLLRAVAPMEESALRTALDRLAAAEFVFARGLPPRATYTFKHALIQEAAYESLLLSERRRYHRTIAQTLEEGFPETLETEPEVVAQHYSEAGCASAAIGLWQRAAERAIARSANAEAVAHLRRGLDIAGQISDPTARAARELGLLSTLAMPLALRQGYAAPDVEEVFLRARELAAELGNSTYLFGIVRGMLGLYEVSGRYAQAAVLADELTRLARESGDAAWEVEAEWEQGSVALFTGRPIDARAHLERAVALYDPALHRMNAYLFGEDPGMMAHVHASLACWLLGDADAALEHSREAIRLGEEVDHPNSLAMALCFAAAVHQVRGELDATETCAEAALQLATEQEFPLWVGLANVFLGWALAQRGRADEGIARMRSGIGQWRATGAEEAVPVMLTFVADALLVAGRASEASAVVGEGLAIATRNGERFYEPELHRVRAESLRALGANAADVAPIFRHGLDLARASGSRALELRLALGLGRLEAEHGRADRGRKLVARVADACARSRDTADFRAATAFVETVQ